MGANIIIPSTKVSALATVTGRTADWTDRSAPICNVVAVEFCLGGRRPSTLIRLQGCGYFYTLLSKTKWLAVIPFQSLSFLKMKTALVQRDSKLDLYPTKVLLKYCLP